MTSRKFIVEVDIDTRRSIIDQYGVDFSTPYVEQDVPSPQMEVENPKYSVEFLLKCANLQLKKSRDYQNPNSSVRQADYYPTGVKTIDEILHAKKLRLRSLIETAETDPGSTPNFESIEDTLMDLVNYASFMAAYINGKIDGQQENRDLFNREIL